MGVLADWTVKISTQGQQEAVKGAAAVKDQLTLGQQAAQAFTTVLGGVAKAFTPIAIAGFVIKKAMESAEGDALLSVFNQIGNTLARLITPFIGLIASALARWIPLLEKIVGFLTPFIDILVQVLDVVFMIGQAIVEYIMTPVLYLMDLVGELLGISTKFEPKTKSKKEQKGGSFEDATAVFKRIQEGVFKNNMEKAQLDALQGIRKHSAGIEEGLKKLQPAVG